MLSPRTFFSPKIFKQLTQAVPRQSNRVFSSTSRIMAQEYKLKGLTSLDLKAGEKREVEVEGIEEGKVLLCNVNGKVSAIGAKCTHYGAPLVKGVLTADGRLTCPWHGGKKLSNTSVVES
jgi:Rieske Fe-S protein